MSDSVRKFAAMMLVAAAASIHYFTGVAPSPQPQPDGKISLSGKWKGVTAEEDRLLVGSLTSEIAEVIEYDGSLEQPRMTAGVHIDDLRSRARDFRCKGQLVRERQPEVNAAIEQYLDDVLGNSGGPINSEQRKLWIEAYREIARACRVSQ